VTVRARGQEIDGQLAFDGSEFHAPGTVDPARTRNALARTLSFEYMGLNPREYDDVKLEMLESVQPENLRPYLIDVPLDMDASPTAVSYTDPNTRRERNIAVTPEEAFILPRSVGAMQRSAAIAAAHRSRTPFPGRADLARQERARIHVQESKLPRVEKYKDMLTEQGELVQKFATASEGRNVGLSMFGGEANMRERFAYLQAFIIGDMIRAYGAQRNLVGSEMTQIDKAITVSILFNPEKTGNFHGLMKLLREYNGHKTLLADQRIESMRRNIGRAGVQA
jgi:hypothetical protein